MKLNFLSSPVNTVSQFYQKHKKIFPVISFVGGFLWDSFTLTRIDRMSDNLILLAYLLLLGIAIILLNMNENELLRRPVFTRFAEWYPLLAQFLLGGLVSSYVVFYFQSAALTKNWLFIGLLVLLLIGNEFLEKRLTNVYLQLTLYFLVSFSFFIFFVPVATGFMNLFIFLFSGLFSLGLFAVLAFFLYRRIRVLKKTELRNITGIVLGMYLLLNLFYFMNWIPPVPLSLKSGGIYHQVSRVNEDYLLKYEKPPWYEFWRDSDAIFHYTEGDTVFCFAAVFAPVHLTKKIYHHWQFRDIRGKQWVTTDHRGYEVVGGRRGGYRGYTYKQNVFPGKWRVDVETEEGQLLGRIGFKIEQVDSLKRGLGTAVR